MTPPFKRYPLIIRVLLMFSMFMFNMGVISFMATRLAELLFGIEDASAILQGTLSQPGDVDVFLFIQGLTSIGGFVLTSMMFAVLETGEFKNRLGLTVPVALKLIAVTIVAIITAQFFIEFLVSINKLIPLPSSLSFLAEYQQKTEELTNAMMSFKDVGHFITTTIVMAVIPAIGEEFFFRGLLLGGLLRGKVNAVLSIILTGIIFSLSHFEYNNLIAIAALGSFLGYLYYISGSLWLPIIAHFTNNFLAVLLKFLFNLGYISEDVANSETPIYMTVISITLFFALVFLLSRWKQPVTFTEEEETESLN